MNNIPTIQLETKLIEYKSTIAQIISDLQDSFDVVDIELCYSIITGDITIVCKTDRPVNVESFILDCYGNYSEAVKGSIGIRFI